MLSAMVIIYYMNYTFDFLEFLKNDEFLLSTGQIEVPDELNG